MRSQNDKKTRQVSVIMGFVSTLSCCICLFFIAPDISAAGSIIVDQNLTKRRLEPYVEYFEDTSGNMTIDDVIRSDDFRRSDSDRLSFGYSHHPYWIRLTVQNPTLQEIDWRLEYNYPPLDHLTVYLRENGQWRTIQTGDHYPFGQRPFPEPTYVIPIHEPPGVRYIYLRIASDGALVVRLTAWSPEAFDLHEDRQMPLEWIYYGIMIALGVYNLLIFISLRESAYFFLFFFIVGFSLFSFVHNGFAFQYLWPDAVWWANRCHPFFVFFTIIWSLMFNRSFLNTCKNLPRLDRFIIGLAVAGIPGMTTPFFLEYYYATQISVSFAAISCLMMILSGIFSLVKGIQSALIYMISCGVFLCGAILFSFHLFGLMAHNFLTAWSLQFGFLMHVLLLSLGVSNKVNIIQNEREKALEALRNSERKYRNIFENATEGIFQSTPGGILLTANPAFVRIMGFESADEILNPGINVKQHLYVKPKDRDAIEALIRQEGEAKNFETQLYRKDKSIIDASINMHDVRDDNGNLLYFEGVLKDITHRKRVEEALQQSKRNLEQRVRERTSDLERINQILKSEIRAKIRAVEELHASEERYRTILDNIEDAYYEVDLAGNFTFFNDAMCDMLGYSSDELIGMNNRQIMDTQTAKKVYQTFNTVYKTGRAIKNFEYEVVVKDGRRRQFEISVSLMKDPNDHSTGFRGIARDITARKGAERELKRAKEAAETANEIKNEFLANMSHEIRTPMNGIIGMCDLAMRTDLDPRQREYMNIIRTSARSLLSLINDILDFSKIEAGKLELETIGFSIMQVIEEVTDMFIDKISDKNLEIIIDISSRMPPRLVGDPLRIKQVLVNLMSNALKFTEKGEISISADAEILSKNVAEIKFCLKDTGIGISKNVQKKLFNVFTQADGSTTRKYGGTGLGLAICKRIVNMMGGDIWVDSEPDAGSSFYFTVTVEFDPTEEEKRIVAPPALQKMKVLVVEDNVSARKILTRYLESFGFEVLVATRISMAKDMLHRFQQDHIPIGIVLIDAGMLDYKTSPRKSLNIGPDVNTPMILMGADVYKKRIDEKDERLRFLVKPVKPSQLFDYVMEMFGYENLTRDSRGYALATNQRFWDIHVLLVEDHPINRRVALEILESAGINVDMAVNGHDALEWVKRKKYDAVLMDIQMPLMDGYEATKQIRKDPKLKTLPVIALTAHAMSGDRGKCIEAGMNDYIPKPIDRKELFSILARNIARLNNNVELEPGFPPITPESKVFPDHIPDSLSGLDIREGIERFGGSWDLYADILDDFCNTQKEFVSEFQDLVEKNDFEMAAIRAHALKGAAGNVSAIKLRRCAKLLESACQHRSRKQIQTMIGAIEAALDEVIDSFSRISSQKTHHRSGSPIMESDLGLLLELCGKLEECLEDADPVSSKEYLSQLEGHFAYGDLEKEVKQLEHQIKAYCFDEAQITLDRLKNAIRQRRSG